MSLKNSRPQIVLLLSVLFLGSSALAQSLSLASGSAISGSSLSLNLSFDAAASAPAGLQWTLSYAPGAVTSLGTAAGPAVTAADKTLTCNSGSGLVTCLAYGMNANVIGSGVVAVVTVTLASTSSGSVPVAMSNVLGASPEGNALAIAGSGGTISVTTGSPAPVSVTPNSGSGSSQTFSFVSSSPRGYAALSTILVIVNNTLAYTGGCYFLYYPASNLLYLANDAGTAWAGSVTLGQSGTVQNSQCTVNAAASSSSGSGNNLTLNVALSFQTAFGGSKNIYVDAYDGTDSGWQLKGSWTVPAATGPPAPVSVTPSSGSGSSQTFSFVSSSPRGYAALSTVLVVVNSTLADAGGCYFLYYPHSNLLYLANDASTAWAGSVTLGQSGTVQNSQCAVNAAASSFSGSGNYLTLNVALSFQTAFGGSKNIYMDAYDGADSGWQLKGSWTILGATGPPAPVSVTPSSGSGATQTFAFVSSSPRGYAALSTILVVVNSTLAGAGGCYFLYYPASNLLYLANDASTTWAGSVTLGQSGTVQNSQCAVNAAASSFSGSGNYLTLNVALSFQTAFGGSKNIYMDAYDGADSGWQLKGSWTVPGATGPPAPVSVMPSSGSGATQTFSFVSSSPRGYAALSTILVVVNSTLAGAGGCYFLYYPASNLLYLANDASTAWAGSVTLGQSGTVQNSQCAVNAAASSSSGSGNNLTLNVPLSFQTAFSGAKNIYMDAYDGADSGWQQEGSWTVPGASGPPAPVSVTPGSGSGNSQTFSFVYSSPRGYSALTAVLVIVNNTLSAPSGCYSLYYPGSRLLYLSNDSTSGWVGSLTPGQSGTLQNSQCTVSGAALSVSGSGNNLTLNVPLSFQTAFSGAKNIYMDAYDGADSGWQQKGSWTIP